MVNILECDSIGHCEKKVHKNICLIPNDYPGRAVWSYKYKSIVNGNKKEKSHIIIIIIIIIIVILILSLKYKFIT